LKYRQKKSTKAEKDQRIQEKIAALKSGSDE